MLLLLYFIGLLLYTVPIGLLSSTLLGLGY